jgi:hypothetical protein
MKRYSIIEKSYGDGDILMEVREGNDGEFVRYDDIKHLLQNTAPDSVIPPCQDDCTYKKCGHCIAGNACIRIADDLYKPCVEEEQ